VVATADLVATEKRPVSTAPGEASPSEASPSEASPSEASPSEASPSEASPSEASPSEASPREASPREASPVAGRPVGFALVDAAGSIVFANEDMASMAAKPVPELLGSDIASLVVPAQRLVARQGFRRSAQSGGPAGSVLRLEGAAGKQFNVALDPRPLTGPDGQQLFVVTGRVRSQHLGPTRRQDLLAAIAEQCDEAIVSVGPTGAVEIWNSAAEDLFGWASGEVVGRQAGVIVPHERQGEADELMSRAWAGETLRRVETVRVGKYGSRVEVSISLAPLRDRQGQVTGVSQVVRDITQQKASERALAYQAMHDHLTGLPNRGLLEDRMAHALERCRREGTSVGVLFFDLDHFKTVNDTAGHEVGDRLLRAVAARLRQSVRSMDTVARLGGDEFVVLCEDIVDDAQLDAIVAHVVSSFSEPVVLADRQLFASVSAGVVRGGPAASVAQLLSQADAAMYQAKARSRGSVVRYDPRTRPELDRKAEGSRLLRLALEARQVMPYYQPIVDLHTGRVVGAEALARWEDPVLGVVLAKDFIPLAEELGLVGEISEMVLAEAGRQVQLWSALSPGLKVAVNVSALQLRGTGLLARVQALRDEGLQPASLVIEVTESALMEDPLASANVLGELRDAGFGIAIDDFGTGYSSLAYLKQLPATSIKVDQTFTAQLKDPHDLSVVMAIMAIADTYGFDVVAEGIETEEQVEVLRSLGCQHGQGYHFARPVPAAEITRMLELSRDADLVASREGGTAHREGAIALLDGGIAVLDGGAPGGGADARRPRSAEGRAGRLPAS